MLVMDMVHKVFMQHGTKQEPTAPEISWETGRGYVPAPIGTPLENDT